MTFMDLILDVSCDCLFILNSLKSGKKQSLVDTNLVLCVAVSPHRATLVNDPVDHDADALLSVHLAPEHLCLAGLGPDLLLLPHALHHLLPH